MTIPERFKKFTELYPKFVAGSKWLDQRAAAGQDVQQDTAEYLANVVRPLSELWEEFNAKEREDIEKVMHVYDQCAGKKITFITQPEL